MYIMPKTLDFVMASLLDMLGVASLSQDFTIRRQCREGRGVGRRKYPQKVPQTADSWSHKRYLESQWPRNGLCSINYGLLQSIVACCFGLLGVPGSGYTCTHGKNPGRTVQPTWSWLKL